MTTLAMVRLLAWGSHSTVLAVVKSGSIAPQVPAKTTEDFFAEQEAGFASEADHSGGPAACLSLRWVYRRRLAVDWGLLWGGG